MFLAFLAIILTLVMVIGVHEYGHALAARIFKIGIKRISIGFGRPLIQSRSARGIEWVLAMWPLGGYVTLLNSRISSVSSKELSHCFDKQPVWVRIIVLLSGVLANIIVSWVALVFIYSVGLSYKVPLVKSVRPDSVAAQVGIVPGDLLISINDRVTPSWREVGMDLVIFWGGKVTLKLKPKGTTTSKDVVLDLSQIPLNTKEKNLLAYLGVVPELSSAEAIHPAPSFYDALAKATHTMGHLIEFFLMVLKQLFFGVIPFGLLLGPVGLFAMSITPLSKGIVAFSFFIASFSLAVAVINLFPVPGLDGGAIVYTLIEKVRGKPISVAVEVLIYRLVFIAFCVLLVQLLLNDLNRYLS